MSVRSLCEHMFVRWENLTTEEDERTRLPGYSRPAVVRHFDAPEALETRFYEVQAKSALNRVPERSRMPFRWTINPYRGCSHGCVYCMAGETEILLADGRTRALADLRPGDAIYGTERRGTYRRFVRTEVLAHWSSVKAAYRITLADGTELVASGDHRFLTSRGWKHVTGAEHGAYRRPHLTLGSELLGTGAFPSPPRGGEDYRRGYVCGMVRGDGHVGRYHDERPVRAHGDLERVRALTDWPAAPSDEWRKGFLGGVFDAVVEASPSRGLRYVRLRGGICDVQRFMHTVDPAITRERDLSDRAPRTDAPLGVVAIEPLAGKRELFDITTGTGDFIANGVVSHNCFARPTHVYLGLNAGRDFEREIVVKVNAPEVLRRELARPSWKGEHVAMGTNTDPYQWVEGRYRLMRGIWEALRDARNPCSILTKSPLVLRDLDLLLEIAEVADVSASFSVPTLDEKAWRSSEPHTPNPRARLEAVGELNRAGIPTGILVAPLMPGINDDPAQVEQILHAAQEAGATSVGGIGLHLRGEVRDVFMGWLRDARPDLVARYQELYARGAYAPKAERERLSALIRRGSFRGRDPGFVLRDRRRSEPPPQPEPAQESLF
jgi:DNA repair photolyase